MTIHDDFHPTTWYSIGFSCFFHTFLFWGSSLIFSASFTSLIHSRSPQDFSHRTWLDCLGLDFSPLSLFITHVSSEGDHTLVSVSDSYFISCESLPFHFLLWIQSSWWSVFLPFLTFFLHLGHNKWLSLILTCQVSLACKKHCLTKWAELQEWRWSYSMETKDEEWVEKKIMKHRFPVSFVCDDDDDRVVEKYPLRRQSL